MNLTHLSIGLNSPWYLFLICLLYFCLCFLHSYLSLEKSSFLPLHYKLHILLLPKDNLTHSHVFTQPYWFLTLVTTSGFPLHRHVLYALPFSPHLPSHPHHSRNVWNSHLGLLWVCIGLIFLFLKCPAPSSMFVFLHMEALLPRVFSMWLLRRNQNFYPTCLRNPPACIPVGILNFVFNRVQYKDVEIYV